MGKKHNSNRAIFVLESPWELDDGDANRTSVLPFVEGIAKMAGDTEVLFANFYDKRSLSRGNNSGKGSSHKNPRSNSSWITK